MPQSVMISSDAALIVASLEQAAEHGGDPTPAVYARLFGAHPEMESLFLLGDLAKGHMLDEVLAVVLDFIGPRTYAPHFMRSEIVNHEPLGVPPEVFMTFFGVVAATLRDLAGAGWTEAMDAAWERLLADLQQAFADPAAA